MLNLNRCVDCIENAREFCKHAVPRCSGDPTTVAQDRLINDKAVLGERCERLLLIGLHQPAVTRYIGGKDCGQLAFKRWRFYHLSDLSGHAYGRSPPGRTIQPDTVGLVSPAA